VVNGSNPLSPTSYDRVAVPQNDPLESLPSADLAEQFLSGYLDLKQNTRAGYYAQIAMLMKWYGDPIDDCRVSPAEEMPELVDSSDLDRIETAIQDRKTHKKLIQRDILLVRTLRYTGMRRAEAAHLRVCDIDFAGRMLD
jgi:integrase